MDMNAVKARFRVVPGGTGGVDAARGLHRSHTSVNHDATQPVGKWWWWWWWEMPHGPFVAEGRRAMGVGLVDGLIGVGLGLGRRVAEVGQGARVGEAAALVEHERG
jgi:hypothetical protein